ncbi:hypothetical protein RPMA_16880 [Tardiphaga alba]|uniref:Uncharacterized protein n=1 Tax=Tardiphaga alba TaxID=340268 RepID=A0ABX8AEV3_9BRAD|nr:hypothetical protein [Tardiphaga alba]QUS40325.1 hypothetical protein RPMA_16880 [Tardiphaga alba]
MISKVVQNERVKLLAGFMNTIAAAFLSAGCIGPALAFFYGLTPAGINGGILIIGSLACMLLSAALHFVGHLALGGIRE